MSSGDIVPIYLNWQKNEKLIGKGKLESLVSNGYTFILEDYYLDDLGELHRIPESLTEVYSYQRWLVTLVEVTDLGKNSCTLGETKQFNIRYLHSIGLQTSKNTEEEAYSTSSRALPDTFLKVDGVEIY